MGNSTAMNQITQQHKVPQTILVILTCSKTKLDPIAPTAFHHYPTQITKIYFLPPQQCS